MTPTNAIGPSAIRQAAPPPNCLSVLGRLDHAEPDHPHNADHPTTTQTPPAALSPSGFRRQYQILLAADAGGSDEAIAGCVGVGPSTVYRTKRRFVEGNLPAALQEAPRPGAGRKLSGKEEALLVATACASPPEGRARWTLELLADAMARLP